MIPNLRKLEPFSITIMQFIGGDEQKVFMTNFCTLGCRLAQHIQQAQYEHVFVHSLDKIILRCTI